MALDKFKAPALPAAPREYNADYFRQVFRAVELYFSQLDSGAFNNAKQYTADTFVGGTFLTPSRAVTATTTATSADYLILANATAGAVTVNLPAAAYSDGLTLIVKKTDVSANAVILDPYASETIDGAATKSTTTQYARFVVVCDGSTWWVIG